MLLVSDTRPLLDLVNTIVNKALPTVISDGGELGSRGNCRSEASGEDFSMVGDDDDDPFLDFAHS